VFGILTFNTEILNRETPDFTAKGSGLVPALETKVDVLLDHVTNCLVQLIAFAFVILI
jgi:hypothetical protein